jgi:hypothetical protein
MTGISAYADGTININTGIGTGSGFTFANGELTVTTNGTYQIIGNGTQTGNRITVSYGVTATITLDNVNISCASQSYRSAFYMTDATVTLLLKNSNILQSGEYMAGIQTGSEISTLTIDSKENPGYFSGTLTVSGGASGAGIGAGNGDTPLAVETYGGIITINGGTIIANGGTNAAGIGGGKKANNGTVTINGGIVTATTPAGGYAACIGGGSNGSAGSISITGGAVVAKGGSSGGIGSGGNFNSTFPEGTITINGGTVYATGNGIGVNGSSTPTTITQKAVVFANTINPNATIDPDAIAPNSSMCQVNENGNVSVVIQSISLVQSLIIPNGITVTLSEGGTGVLNNWGIIQNFGTLTSTYYEIVNRAKIINNGVINCIVNEEWSPVRTGILGEWIQDIPALLYTGNAITPDVTIIKPGTGTLIKDQDYVIKNYSNNINVGTAIVTVEGIGNYAGTMTKIFAIDSGRIDLNNISTNGIYGYDNNIVTVYQSGNYVITGSTTTDRIVVQSGVTATLKLDSASITSSNHALDVSSDATVTLLLKHSNVLQTTGINYAGLHVPAGGTIVINSADGSGILTANGGLHGAGIGSGFNEGSTGDITIKGGTVNAQGGEFGAGIGAGENCTGGTIVIDGGIINAYGSTHGAAIGGGYNGSNSGSIIINGGVINANNSSSARGAGIGGGTNNNTGNIIINNGIVNAIGSKYGAGIGGGMNGTGGNITIYGGTINANGRVEGAGIGGGINGSGGNIVIYGGIIIANGGINGAAGIGGGHSGGPGTLSMNGNAIVFASSVSDNSSKTKGILFNGNTGIMYGNVRLKQDATIPFGKTWTISNNQIFEISTYATLTHNGIIYNNGMINNFGTITGSGTIIGNSVIDEDINDYNNFDTYEVEGKLAVADIFYSQDLTGGIIGTIGFDDYDDEDNFFDPMIDLVVLDKETNTILYEIYIDETSNTYTSNPLVYFNDELGEGAEFFPVIWESDDILSSIESIEEYRYQNGYIPSSPYLQDSIDVIVTATVYNAKLNSVKIPGIGYIGFEEDSESASLLGFWDWMFGKKKDCFDASMQDKCPCNIWNEIKTPDTSKNSDLIVAAHRGTWGENLGSGAPENSRSAIQATVGKTSVIEVDVMKTKDDKLVLSHDYGLKRLSEYTGNDYWFNLKYYSYTPIAGQPDGLLTKQDYQLRKRDGVICNDRYLLFEDLLDILKKNGLAAFIDIKPLMRGNKNGTCINCNYNPATPEGRDSIRTDWIDILKKCIEIASKKDALDYVAFKPTYRVDELTIKGGISSLAQLLKVRFMPVIQSSTKKEWDQEVKSSTLNLIHSWAPYWENVVAFETNFKSLDEVYLKPFDVNMYSYDNILHYVSSLGFRPGIFSEDPVGPKGLASRWGDWHVKNSATDIRGDHLILMSVPHFETAVVTGDRYDVWRQINTLYNASSLLSETMASFEENISTVVDVMDAIERINVRYIPGSIIIDGLNNEDINSDIILYDTQGRLIYKDKVKDSPQTIISKILPKGIYVLKLSGNRQITVKLIVNQ